MKEKVLIPFARVLARAGLTPMALTLAAFVAGLVVVVAAAMGNYTCRRLVLPTRLVVACSSSRCLER